MLRNKLPGMRIYLFLILAICVPITLVAKSGQITVNQTAEIKDPQNGSDDQFGYSVAISGATLAVGAPQFAGGAGVAYVFVNSGGSWKEAAKLTSGNSQSIEFGASVAVTASLVVVGTPDDGNANGIVYLFVKPQGGWKGNLTPTAQLTVSAGTANLFLGTSVAVSADGTTIAAGAPGQNNNGAVDVFVKPESGWTDVTEPTTVLSSFSGHEIGNAVAMSDNTIVAGENNSLNPPQAAFVYVQPQAGWANSNGEPTATLTASDNNFQVDRFAYSVAVGSNTIVVGAPFHPDSAPGTAYVYSKPKTGWADMTQTAELTVPANYGIVLGNAVGLFGNVVLAGAPANSIGHNVRQGNVFGYVKPLGGWVNSMAPSGAVTASDGEAQERFGDSIAVSGKNIAVGAPYYGGALQGAVYIFSLQ